MQHNSAITAPLTKEKAWILIATFMSIYGKDRMPDLPVMAMAEPLTL